MDGATGRHILVVEDHALNRQFIAEVLKTLHWEATFAVNAEDALLAAATGEFDAMLIDLQLPDLCGQMLLQQLRELGGLDSVPAIAMSADMDRDAIRTLLSQGFDECLPKPLEIARLQVALSNCDQPGAARTPAADEVQAVPAGLPALLDDAMALQTSGNLQITQHLRALFASELATEQQALGLEIDSREYSAARARLHRILAAAGFCGAVRLSLSAQRLHAVLLLEGTSIKEVADARQHFDQVAGATVAALKTA